MIRKTTRGYRVVGKKGKPLSKPTLRKGQAEERLRQVEHFKNLSGHGPMAKNKMGMM